MNYKTAFSDFFLSPKWTNNLLFAALLMLIPGLNIAGAMIIAGWLIEGFWCRTDESPVTFPELNLNRAERYVTLGLWPVLLAIILFFAIALVYVPVAIIASFLYLAWLVALPFELAFFVIIRPLMLRASLTQDFAKAFDIKFLTHFIKVMLPELVISSLILTLIFFVVGLIGIKAFVLGYLLKVVVMGVVLFAIYHLDKQLYKMYLTRGGEAIPLSPKLTPLAPAVVPVEPAAP